MGEAEIGEALTQVEQKWPGSFWVLAKGKVRSEEPLFGFQVLFGSDEILAEGEGESAVEAIGNAMRQSEGRANG